METRAILGILALICTLAFVVPAQAVIIGGVDYTLYARCKIGLEGGGIPPTTIDGNVRVAQDDPQVCKEGGFLQIGNGVTITGTASANRMSAGSGADVGGACSYNVDVGGASAACEPPPHTAFTADASWPPVECPVPVVNPGTINFTCTLAASPCDLTLAGGVPGPGQYKHIRVRDGAILNLGAGTYQATSLLVENKATLNGAGSTVNLTGNFTTEPGAFINDVTITSVKVGTAAAITTGNGATVTNSFFNAPLAQMHLRQNGTYSSFEGCAVLITVQPNTFDDQRERFCACPQGFKFQNPSQLPGGPIVGNLQDSRNCVPCDLGDNPPAFPTCP